MHRIDFGVWQSSKRRRNAMSSATTSYLLRKLITITITSIIICSTAYADKKFDNESACRDEDSGYACQYKNDDGSYVPGVCKKSSGDSRNNVCVPKVNSQNPE
jgi:hypothetical protein